MMQYKQTLSNHGSGFFLGLGVVVCLSALGCHRGTTVGQLQAATITPITANATLDVQADSADTPFTPPRRGLPGRREGAGCR